MLSSGLSNESNVGIDYIKNQNDGFIKIINEKKPNAAFTQLDSQFRLTLFFSRYGQGLFYLPPKSEESTFGLSIETMAYRKGFQYKQQFDKM